MWRAGKKDDDYVPKSNEPVNTDATSEGTMQAAAKARKRESAARDPEVSLVRWRS